MAVLAVFSNKGGVGKTAAAVNLSYLAAESGIKTLLCDLDPQGSATFYLGVPQEIKGSAKSFAKGGDSVRRSIRPTAYADLAVLPADISHRNLALAFSGLKHSKRRLGRLLEPLREVYPLIILDCPPTISLLAENIFDAAEVVLVPLVPTTLSLQAHRQLLAFAGEHDYAARSFYAFLSMVDRRKKLHRELSETAAGELPGVLQTAIPYASPIERMGVERQPVPRFAPASPAAAAYRSLWSEVGQVIAPAPAPRQA